MRHGNSTRWDEESRPKAYSAFVASLYGLRQSKSLKLESTRRGKNKSMCRSHARAGASLSWILKQWATILASRRNTGTRRHRDEAQQRS